MPYYGVKDLYSGTTGFFDPMIIEFDSVNYQGNNGDGVVGLAGDFPIDWDVNSLKFLKINFNGESLPNIFRSVRSAE